MSEDAAIRRANLQAICKKRGWKAKDLQAAMGGGYAYWRDLLTDSKKSFGEKIARRIEERLELGRGSLDEYQAAPRRRYPAAEEKHPHDAPPPAPPRDFSDRHAVSDSDRALLQDVRLGATPEELGVIHDRAALIRRRVEEMMSERVVPIGSTRIPSAAAKNKPRK